MAERFACGRRVEGAGVSQSGEDTMPWEPDRKKRLAAADRVLEESVDSIACELRPALRSVLKLARQIREFDGTPDSDTREYADYVRASAEHMSVMIGRLRRQPHAVRPGRDGC